MIFSSPETRSMPPLNGLLDLNVFNKALRSPKFLRFGPLVQRFFVPRWVIRQSLPEALRDVQRMFHKVKPHWPIVVTIPAMIDKDTSRQTLDSVAGNSMRRSSGQFVTMMQAAQSRPRQDSAGRPLIGLLCASGRGFLCQPEMRPVMAVIADVFGNKTLQSGARSRR